MRPVSTLVNSSQIGDCARTKIPYHKINNLNAVDSNLEEKSIFFFVQELNITEADQTEKSKRRWDRYKVEIRVKVSLTRNAQHLTFTGTAHDISEGGMGLFLTGELIIGETISIDFAMPYSQRRVLKGVVRNRDSFNYGVQYLNPTPEDRADIVRNCRALALLTR